MEVKPTVRYFLTNWDIYYKVNKHIHKSKTEQAPVTDGMEKGDLMVKIVQLL